MVRPVRRGLWTCDERLLVTVQTRRAIMKWETPEAIDMRFGMEITMYISNR